MLTRTLAPLCALALSTVASAQEAPPVPVDTLKEVTRVLSSDEFEGRAPGTPGEEKTIAYLEEQFAAAGLEPGNNGSWVQEVPLVEIAAQNIAPLTIAGADYSFGDQWVGVTYREQDHVALDDSEIVFVGFGINAPERGWNDYAGVDMHGKTALILVNDADYAADTLEGTFNGRAMTYYGRWTYKFEEAARQGAAGAIIIHADFPAAYGWNVVESSWSGPQVYAARNDGGMSQTLVNGWVTHDVAEKIASAAGMDLAQMEQAATQPGFTAVPLGITASTSFDNDIRRFASANVVGVLPGSERPDEYVLHTAHWDHLGRCTPAPDGDDICNGAVDNATGTAALVALAKMHHEAGAPARSLAFVAVTAEESGLLGSEYYGANPVFPLSQTVGGVNMDALYVLGPARDVVAIGGGKSELDATLERAVAAQGRTITADPSPQAGYYYRSDHFSLAKRGVPMLYVKSGEDLFDGGFEAGEEGHADYTAHRYHGPKDEYDPNWDWSGVAQDVGLYYAIGRELAESADWPNWVEGDEFRATRDASCAAGEGC
ncbi:peptidase M28 [Aurantiacibacter xanthus]|uniref:Peptidase M28 n=1 Tax=Aurantiacibacter xanthus TaxID=1784712 RepID=A0A3A1P2L4_9SPHN|nr:peptidase M28 [Aurantiacibacter xanthus]